MARYRRRRYYRKKSGRWSANIQEISSDIVNAVSGANYSSTVLAFNPLQTNTATSQVYTVKNFEISFTFESPAEVIENIEDITAYIMFVPQGMTITASYNNQHPEYIMAYKYIGSPVISYPSSSSANETQQFH